LGWFWGRSGRFLKWEADGPAARGKNEGLQNSSSHIDGRRWMNKLMKLNKLLPF